MLRYAQYPPSPEFARLIECYWCLEGPGAFAPDPVIPDGRVELIFHYGRPFRSHAVDGGIERQPTAIVAGQITAPVVLSCDGTAGVAAIRLRPGAVGSALRIRADLLTDRVVRLDNVTSLGSIESELADSRTDRDRIAALERWLSARAVVQPRPDITAAVEIILASGGTAPINNLTKHIPLSRRQLERLFPEHVGLSPKTFARIVRLRRAVGFLSRGYTLAHVAAACGYFDQPHMVRDFRQLLQGTPKKWQQVGGEFSTLFSDQQEVAKDRTDGGDVARHDGRRQGLISTQ